MNDRAVALGLVGVLAIGLTVLFFATYEREEYEYFVEPAGSAASNPFLAAERFLDQLGHEVSSRQNFAPSMELPQTGGIAVLTFSYAALRDEDLDLLLHWVASGGHLVVRIGAFRQDVDPIFTSIGVEALYRGEAERSADDTANWDALSNPGRQDWGSVVLDNGVSIDFGDNEPLWTVRDQFGEFAGQIAYDKGTITAVADIRIFRNRWIADADHAFLLSRIVGPAGAAGPIWLVRDFGYPSLWSLITERAPHVLAAGGLTLLLLLWWATQRFGPPIAPPQRARKAFVEHIEASGRFLWRNRRHAHLLQSARSAFLRDAHRRHPRLHGQTDAQTWRYLARVCGVSDAEATEALASTASRNHAQFQERIQILKTMWTRL